MNREPKGRTLAERPAREGDPLMPEKRSGPVRTLLLEDHAAFRQAMTFLLEREPNFEVVAQAGTLAEARRSLPDGVDLAIVDLALPEGRGMSLSRSCVARRRASRCWC